MASAAENSWYRVDEEKLEALRKKKEWMSDVKYFKRVMVSPVASVKMLMHTYSGCEEGMRQGGKPLEVMGMLLGCPSDTHPDTLVVTDVFPLPVTGFETRVVADDESVINYMIELSEMIERTRKERIMGWYHSHPFDVDEAHNHCFLSSTDMSTQLAWQNAEDGNGNPFLAIVIDPLRSFAKNRAEIGAFRAYPPNHNAPAGETPDGKVIPEEAKRVERWGACWGRYYELTVEYFISEQAKIIIDVLNNSFLWTRTLGSTPMLEAETRQHVGERIATVTEKLETANGALAHGSSGSRMSLSSYMPIEAREKNGSVVTKAAQASCGLATEATQGQMTQVAKQIVFM
ncbi:COP9 signalosome complex subunit 5A [Pelagophyceae sp. CCMP2097]|nr:COP9 signalosome complex subunit 5A [Pelagophyceae sp. CCMP2097]